jgi:hypothetical protein
MENQPIRLMDEVTVTVRDQVVGRGLVIGHAFDDPPRFDVSINGEIVQNLTPDKINV